MNRFSVLLLLVALAVTLSCGNAGAGMAGTGRQLQSITITQTTNGQQIQFLATGTFSAPPTTVSPLPVAWTLGLMAPPPPTYTYTLTTQPYEVNCTTVGPEDLPVVAFAPPNPSAPSSGSSKTVIQAAVQISCQ
jgi:hypothetical protein